MTPAPETWVRTIHGDTLEAPEPVNAAFIARFLYGLPVGVPVVVAR